MLSVVLSLLMLLAISSRPPDALLGRVPGMKGFHNCEDYPEAETIPGLLLYRFNANVVFYNADYARERVLAAITAADTPVEWVVIDASPINVVDVTALKKFDELREELHTKGIVLAIAHEKRSMKKHFEGTWVNARRQLSQDYSFPTLKSAVRAFKQRGHQPGSAQLDGPVGQVQEADSVSD
jgi:SulP family sulfate permease